MKKVSPLNYAFALGKVRVLERFLIREEVFEEAIDSNLNEALRLFAESDLYSEELLHVKDSQQLEAVLSAELIRLKNLVGDLILDKELLGLIEFGSLKCIADTIKNYPSEFLQDYLKHTIDMHNIKTFLRLYVLKEPLESLRGHLVCDGFIKKDVLLELYSQGLAAFLNKLEYVHKHSRVIDYAYFLKEGIEEVEKKNSFVSLEKAINNFLIQELLPAKYFSFGPEAVLAYYFAKVNEMNLIRMIILAKFNDVPGVLVKERLNSVYA